MAQERHIALLRGINVGRAKRIAMADLRQLIADLGFGEVRSLLNSGNAVFAGGGASPVDSARRIEEALVLKLGVAARVTVLSATELGAIVADNPLLEQASDPSRLLVFVPNEAAGCSQVGPLMGQDWKPEALALGRRAAYLWCPAGVIDSRLASVLGKLLGDGVTSRNWNTIIKLHAMAQE